MICISIIMMQAAGRVVSRSAQLQLQRAAHAPWCSPSIATCIQGSDAASLPSCSAPREIVFYSIGSYYFDLLVNLAPVFQLYNIRTLGSESMGESRRVIMAVAEPVARLVVLVRLRTPTDSLLPCRRTRRHPAHRARECCPWMSTADPVAMRATELSSSASAPQRPFHRPQNDVAAHPQRRPGARTAVAPPRGLT